MTVRFNMTEDGVRLMAAFVAQLVREGVTFQTSESPTGFWEVTLTGGF